MEIMNDVLIALFKPFIMNGDLSNDMFTFHPFWSLKALVPIVIAWKQWPVHLFKIVWKIESHMELEQQKWIMTILDCSFKKN